jgi:coproporphyrinogen III oxidase-like Fe-S oxidoreductase/ferredoxin
MACSSEIASLIDLIDGLYTLDTSGMEISIETTPRIAADNSQKLKDYYSMGIRRVSMGLQTTDINQAKLLDRWDANANVIKSLSNVRDAGFTSFNVDLMYGFPLPRSARNSGVDPWAKTLEDCVELGPEHITLYRMRYKGTKMAHLQDRVSLAQVNEQAGLAHEILTRNGYAGMIGKNTYSKINSGCSDYLDKRVRRAVPYLGFGLGAQSFSHYTLAYNLGAVTKTMDQYLKSVELGRLPIQDLYHLPRELAMGKMVSVSFYYGGIDLQAFEECFNVQLEEMFPDAVHFVLAHGLMRYTSHDGESAGRSRLQLATTGKRHFGGCVALFYSPAVQEYLMSMSGGELGAGDPIDALKTNFTVSLPRDQGEPHTIEHKKTVPLIFEGAGETLLVEAALGSSLYDVAREHGITLEAACRGECACSTCHVKLPDLQDRNVPVAGEQEQDMLDLATAADASSRLACQVRVDDSLRGARIMVPDSLLTRGKGLFSKRSGKDASMFFPDQSDQLARAVA